MEFISQQSHFQYGNMQLFTQNHNCSIFASQNCFHGPPKANATTNILISQYSIEY